MVDKEVKLKVVEALQDDAYKGIARIDFDVMKRLGVRRGDVIIIAGARESVAIVDRAYPADVGENIVRIDGIIRKNSKTGIGETVGVKKVELKEAKKVTIAPAQKGIMVQADSEVLKQGLLGRALIKGDIVVMGGAKRRRDVMSDMDFFSDIFEDFGGGFNGLGGIQQIRFSIVSTSPGGVCVITEQTEITLSNKAVDVSEENIPNITYEDIGGLTEEVKKIREMVELPLKHPEIFDRLGIEPPKGVLLHGPPGTGKTLLAKAVANESEANFILINGPELMSKFYGESEKNLRDKFEEAEKSAPSIIFIDEIDSIAPKREDVQGEVERRVVSQLLTMMDGLNARGKVVVIAATNRPNAIDPALRRPGRFDREVVIGVPDKKGRLQVLKIHTRNMPLDKDVDLEDYAARTHGFVGADLESLAKEAAMSVLRKILPDLNLKEEDNIPSEILENLKITKKDFDEAMRLVRPSAMREVLVETPNTKWDDIGGLDNLKQELIEAVEWPLKYPDSFERIGIRPPRGVLLYGPPGTGKTLLAKAVANESEANFIQVKGPSLLSMWVGESEKGIRKIFQKAREVAPCVIFFDEIDSIASKRGMGGGSKVTDQVLNQLLAEMDGLEELQDVTVIGATNRPDMLDSALLRPGRFDRILLVETPDEKGREKIFQIHTKKMPLNKNVSIKDLAKRTDGYVGADIESLVREAAMLALRKDINVKEINKEHFEEAMKKVKASVGKETLERYKKIEEHYLKSAKAALESNGYLG
ncbi:MAG: CDC48 family AAA ATPase [Nanoarchaeota archaeon]|nr:CDC48 family AAA ATPase [Nanoarchaeota archaeon]